MTRKQKLYVTFSLLLATTIVSSVVTFSFLNINVKPGVKLISSKNETQAYEGKVDLSIKLIRIPKYHTLEYKWFAKTSEDNEYQQINKEQNSVNLSIENKNIEKVQYYVQVNDLSANKTYKSEVISVNYVMPLMYLSAKKEDGRIINPYLETIKDDKIKIIVNFDDSVSKLDSEEGWYIYTKNNEENLRSIKKLLVNNVDNEFNFINNSNFTLNEREMEILNLSTLKEKLGKEFVIRYFWTDIMGKDLYQDLQLKFD